MNREGVHSRGADPVPSVESLTASTESETFDSWTVVSEGAKKNMKTALDVPVDHEEEDEEEDEEEAEETPKQLDEEQENRSIEIIKKDESNKRDNESTDDLSDGISIISDSESAGRISPHPFNRQVPETGTNESEESAKEDAPYNPLTPPTTPLKEAETCTKVTSFVERSQRRQRSTKDSQPQEQPRRFFGLGVRGIFVVSVVVAVLAFVGRLNYPWETEPDATGVAPMMEKLEQMELQNNFLRAEIDILTKQINFLKTKHQPEAGPRGDQNVPYKQDGKQYDKYEKKKEKPKWSGSGDMYIKPLEPYRKPSPLPPPPSYDAEKQGKPTEKAPTVYLAQQPHYESKGDYYERKPGKEEYQKYPDTHKYPPKDGKYNPKYDPKYDPNQKYDPKYDPKYEKHENGRPHKSEDHKMAKGDYYSKEKYYKDDHEKYRKVDSRKDSYSGDGYHEKHDYKRKEDDWHEKMMHQREEMRRKQDRHNSNNWYIERGNGREEARFDSREYRREGR